MSDSATIARPTAPVPSTGQASRRWWMWLWGIAATSLVIQGASVVGRRSRVPGGDSYYYWAAAKLLVQGHGFINPFTWNQTGVNSALMIHGQLHTVEQTANWPPLFTLLLSVPHIVGLTTFFETRLYCCFLGAGAILLVGCAAREIGGPRVGLVAAAICAVNPNLWMNSDLALSEVMTPGLVAWVLWMAWRFWKQPSWRTAIWLGFSLGVAMLGRDELTLLVVFVAVPLVLLARQVPLRHRLALLATVVGLVGAVVGPWAIYNTSRFEKPVFISTGLGVTLASANCDATWSGQTVGYWSMPCALASGFDPKADESVQASQEQAHAMTYIRAHLSELPKVELIRLARASGFYKPTQQIKLDSTIETRPYHWAMVGLGCWYVLLALSLVATWVMRKRRMLLFPLWMLGLNAACSVLLTFGNTRYRVPFEVPVGIMGAVALVWLFDRIRGHRDHGADLAPSVPAISKRTVAAI